MSPADFRAAKRRLGMTWAALAEATGINPSTLHRYSRGALPVPKLLASWIAQREKLLAFADKLAEL